MDDLVATTSFRPIESSAIHDRRPLVREMVNLGFTWQLRPNLTLQFDVANVFNEPLTYYRGIPDQLETFIMQSTTITAGVQGRF